MKASEQFKRLIRSPKIRNSLTIIVLAAVLLLLITAIQYQYSHDTLDKELDHRAEKELSFKAVLIKGMLNSTEQTLRSHAWYVKQSLDKPDEMYQILSPIVISNPDILNCAVAFVPDYYPSRWHLFEPFSKIEDGHVVTRQIAGPDHDYTRMGFYRSTLEEDTIYWSDPYPDTNGTNSLITSCSMPIRNNKGNTAGVFVYDVSLDWLSDTLNARQAYPSSFVMLLSENGDLICHPNSQNPRYKDVFEAKRLINDSTIT